MIRCCGPFEVHQFDGQHGAIQRSTVAQCPVQHEGLTRDIEVVDVHDVDLAHEDVQRCYPTVPGGPFAGIHGPIAHARIEGGRSGIAGYVRRVSPGAADRVSDGWAGNAGQRPPDREIIINVRAWVDKERYGPGCGRREVVPGALPFVAVQTTIVRGRQIGDTAGEVGIVGDRGVPANGHAPFAIFRLRGGYGGPAHADAEGACSAAVAPNADVVGGEGDERGTSEVQLGHEQTREKIFIVIASAGHQCGTCARTGVELHGRIPEAAGLCLDMHFAGGGGGESEPDIRGGCCATSGRWRGARCRGTSIGER